MRSQTAGRVENAHRFNLQNRLGFVVALARRVADMRDQATRSTELSRLESMLRDSRLVKEDFFLPSASDGERGRVVEGKPDRQCEVLDLLTDISPEHLRYTR